MPESQVTTPESQVFTGKHLCQNLSWLILSKMNTFIRKFLGNFEKSGLSLLLSSFFIIRNTPLHINTFFSDINLFKKQIHFVNP